MTKPSLSANEYKRKLEHQIYLAQEHPAKIYDLSDCNIREVPKGVFSYCKVLRKFSLNLSDNSLSSLQSGGNLDDLSYLGVLILSKNRFTALPKDILQLVNLKKLIIDNNKIHKFPLILTQLPNLKLLNLEGNLIKSVPEEVNQFKSLESLNINKNPLTEVSSELCEISTLKFLKINLENVKNIEKKILQEGLDSVWAYFCQIKQVPYRSIKNNFTDGQENSDFYNYSSKDSDLRYTRMGDEIEREIMEHDQKMLIVENEDRLKSLDEIKKKIQMEDDIITAILSKKQSDNDKLLDAMAYDEMNTNELISQIFEYNNQARKKEELIDIIEQQNWCYYDKRSSLTIELKSEILTSMKNLFLNSLESTRICNDTLSSTRSKYLEDNQQLIFDQDEQKLAFIQLKLEKDPQLSRLRNEIEIVEKKLQQLTAEDMNEGFFQIDNNRSNRNHLVNLLKELKSEKEDREKLLIDQIEIMGTSRSRNQPDFWIMQYQNIRDDKLKSNYEVQEFLKMAKVEDWIPVFTKHDYTIDMMLDLTMNDLDKLQVQPDYMKSKFLAFINEWKFNPIKGKKDNEPSAPSEYLSTCDKPVEQQAEPSAPPLMQSISQNSNQESSVVMARKEAECCICLTLEARILLLNCGHVCCCKECSFTIRDCPLCRQKIVQRVNLEFSF